MSSPDFFRHVKQKIGFFARKIKNSFFILKRKQKYFWLAWFGIKSKQQQVDYDKMLVANLSKKRVPRLRQIKYLKEVVSVGQWRLFKLAVILLLIAVALLGMNIYLNLEKVAAVGGVYTEGVVGVPSLINPLYTTLNDIDQDLATLIYSGLVKIDKHHQLVPDLAESWTVSEDQKEYIFTLRDNVRWHDGQLLTTGDVLFTIKTIQDAEFKSPLASNFNNVEVMIMDDRKVKFLLSESYALFLENLTVGILPAHIWREVVPANAFLTDYNLRPIGSGPYKFKSLTKDKLGNIKLYSLERNDDYLPQAPFLKQINFKFYPDFETAASALKNHNVDGISYLPKDLQELISSRKSVNQHLLSLPQYTALFFNQKNNKALDNLNVRKALALALDKQEILDEALLGEGQVIEAPILAGFIGYNPNISKYETNIEEAEKLLDEAGWKKETMIERQLETDKKNAGEVLSEQEPDDLIEVETGEFRYKNDEQLKIVLSTVNRSENFKAAQIIQRMWQKIGIKVDLKIIEAAQIQGDVIRNRNFEVLLFGEIFGTDPDPYPFWHSSQAGESGLNLSNFVNKEADQVLEEARQISDPEKRHNKYVHFQNILNQYLPAIFLYTPKYIYPVSSQIKGIDVRVISIPADRFANIEEWYIKTKPSLK